ncbi:hypothetical protein A3371_005913 [Escherichia coli]|nr:hypothetical protein [Escherichia coli]EFJ5864549.1 hypothetical protein [Escherichia coli]
MAKIYDFPQGAERRRMHRKIQWNNAVKLSKNGWSKPEVKRWSFLAFISTGWYYFRLSVAVIFHIITICGLAVLAALSNTIFWIGGAICLVTWYTNDHQIWSANNLTIPIVFGLWVLSLVAAPLIDFFSQKLPFYRLLVPDAKREEVGEDDS